MAVGTVNEALRLLEDPLLREKEKALEGYGEAIAEGIKTLKGQWKMGEVLRELEKRDALEDTLAKLEMSTEDGASYMAAAAVPMDEYCTPDNALAYFDR